MSKRILALLAVSSLTAVAALAQPAPEKAAPPQAAKAPPAVASASDPIASRQVMMQLSAGTFGEMKMVADAGGDLAPLSFGARALTRWARSIPGMFPAGSMGPQSHARAEIWSNRADFEARAAAYQAAATQLAEAARAGDRAAFNSAWDTTRQACQACHERFRASTP
jgi:cytochrome c556